jgi:hypothetical protein
VVFRLLTQRRGTGRRRPEPRLAAAAVDEVGASVHVSVGTIGVRVILRGTVRSWAEHEDAARAAWPVEGVSDVDNLLTIGIAEYARA